MAWGSGPQPKALVQRATLVASLRHERCFSRPKNELRVAEQSIQGHLPIDPFDFKLDLRNRANVPLPVGTLLRVSRYHEVQE